MKTPKTLLLALTGLLSTTLVLQAQVKTAAPSPASKLDQVVGVTNFTVEYSRPSVKDREIYGGLVPYDEIWRTGANAPTKLSYDSEITFGDETVPAGDYVLFTIPGEKEWTVILYGDAKVANTGAYDEKNDVARVTVTPTALAEPVESFTIGFDDLRDDSATLFLDWANLRVPVPITIDTASISGASIEEAMKNQDDWTARDYANAAEFLRRAGQGPRSGHRVDEESDRDERERLLVAARLRQTARQTGQDRGSHRRGEPIHRHRQGQPGRRLRLHQAKRRAPRDFAVNHSPAACRRCPRFPSRCARSSPPSRSSC